MKIPLNIDWQQILLHLFNFAALFAILYYLLYSPVKKFIARREEYFKKLDDDAKKNLADSENTLKEYKQKLANAEKEISDMKDAAHRNAESARALKLEDAEAEAKKIIDDALEASEREHRKMISEAKSEISDMAAGAAAKLAAGGSTSESFDSFLDTVKRGESNE